MKQTKTKTTTTGYRKKTNEKSTDKRTILILNLWQKGSSWCCVWLLRLVIPPSLLFLPSSLFFWSRTTSGIMCCMFYGFLFMYNCCVRSFFRSPSSSSWFGTFDKPTTPTETESTNRTELMDKQKEGSWEKEGHTHTRRFKRERNQFGLLMPLPSSFHSCFFLPSLSRLFRLESAIIRDSMCQRYSP